MKTFSIIFFGSKNKTLQDTLSLKALFSPFIVFMMLDVLRETAFGSGYQPVSHDPSES